MNQETGIMQQISQMRSSLLELKIREFNPKIKNYCNLRTITTFVFVKRINLQKDYMTPKLEETEFDLAKQNLEYQEKNENN